MIHLLLIIIYLSFISLGLPDAILGSAWPAMYREFQVPVSYAGAVSMIIAIGTVISSLQSDRLTRRLQDASGKTIRLKNRVDPACRGGVRLELAGRSIDGSVRAQLESLRRQLMADLA